MRSVNIYVELLGIESALRHFHRGPAVPPTNNAAERALRGFVIKRNLSFFSLSGRGFGFLEWTLSKLQVCQTFGCLQEIMQAGLAVLVAELYPVFLRLTNTRLASNNNRAKAHG